jgi:multiple sugar transport system substrate-binding protein
VRVIVATALVVLAATVAGCASGEEPTTTRSATPTPTASGPVKLTLAVYGPKPVTDVYRKIAASYTAQHPDVQVSVDAYASHAEAMAAYQKERDAGDPPDVFLMDRDDLATLQQEKALRRVDDLLTDREIDFGDSYSRPGLEAFSDEASLQCFPEDVSPMVIYYNPKLIELDAIADPGSRPVTQDTGWSLADFAKAAAQPRRPGVRGLYVAPDLEQVAPFIWSGGGQVVDDNEDPTKLTLSDGASTSALERLLEVVRDPALTFSQVALHRQSAIERFKAGRLGMLLGFRDLTPVFRAEPSLTFDVMPLPRLGQGTTISQMSGLCVSADSQHVEAAGDLLAQLISDHDATLLAQTGYVMPANLDVVNDDAFLQTGQRPLHSEVFSREVRDTQLLPDSPRWATVAQATAADLTQLFYDPVILPLQERLQAIDDASVPMFTPPTQTPSPSTSPSSSP